MRPDVAAKALRDARRSFLWWSLGLVGLVALLVSVYPSIRGTPSLTRLVEDYPQALKGFIGFGGEIDYSTPAGYLGIEIFSTTGPIVFLVAAIANGAAAIAGEEERGTLDLLLANPVSRRRVAVEKLAALGVELAGLAFVLWLALVVATRAASMAISIGNLAAACCSLFLLALGFGALALLVGAAGGRRTHAIAVATAVAVATYLVNSLAPLSSALDRLQPLSPFYHYSAGDPLRHGLSWHALVLLAVALVLAALAPAALDRRDLR